MSERLEQQGLGQAGQLRESQKEFAEQIEKLATDVLTQLRATHKELSDRLDKLTTDSNERLRNLQTEARQRDDSLRQELLMLAETLDDKKTSRHDLGQMLVEMGQRLRSDNEAQAD